MELKGARLAISLSWHSRTCLGQHIAPPSNCDAGGGIDKDDGALGSL